MALLTPGRLINSFILSSVLFLTSCSQSEICAFVGDWAGTFYGDASGDLVISIIDEDTPGEAIVQLTLENAGTLVAEGTSVIDCEQGEINLELKSPGTDDKIGDFSGNLKEDGTSEAGEWTFDSGEHGEWDASMQQ